MPSTTTFLRGWHARLPCRYFVYVLEQFFSSGVPPLLTVLVVVLSVFIGFAAPDAFVSRRQRLVARLHRQVFPDLLDLLVVCVDAGMTVESAFSPRAKRNHEALLGAGKEHRIDGRRDAGWA